jgi:hypothetical protein
MTQSGSLVNSGSVDSLKADLLIGQTPVRPNTLAGVVVFITPVYLSRHYESVSLPGTSIVQLCMR